MIRIIEQALPPHVQAKLDGYQAELDAVPDYAARVELGKQRYKSASQTVTFNKIRDALAAMCSGNQRCMYCEDSGAGEIEHFRPKDLYPEAVFVWANYLYACATCNRKKSNRFAVFAADAGTPTDVTRKPKAAVTAPLAGDPLLIDPRHENPFDFLWLDLINTFNILPYPTLAPDSRQQQRARYTIDLLGLNRDVLVTARQQAFISYARLLHQYIAERDHDSVPVTPQQLRESISLHNHRTVWREMQRYHQLGFQQLAAVRRFTQAPEALHW